MAALAQLHAQPGAHRYQVDAGRLPALEAPSLEEVQALQISPQALLPEEVDLEGIVRGTAPALNAADDLRLPAPPIKATTAQALMQGTDRALEAFHAQVGRPVSADPAALAAEARMVALLTGIQGLQAEIRTRAAQAKPA